MDSLDELLESCREGSLSERGKGTTFEDSDKIIAARRKVICCSYLCLSVLISLTKLS